MDYGSGSREAFRPQKEHPALQPHKQEKNEEISCFEVPILDVLF
jgi:hypothetical protein